MSNNALVVMAAGIGSRFGGGIKQLEPVGPSGEIIMDYSVYDAIEAGFKKVVFIIRKDLEDDFKAIIGNRLSKYIEVEYVFQNIDDLPDGFKKPADRTKPWGTGQAVLSCAGVIQEPFVVINADDYYGKEAFKLMNEFLSNIPPSGKQYHFCMAGFQLGNTLSENGAVTRGICVVNGDHKLIDIEETFEIRKEGSYAVSDKGLHLSFDRPVSMNMWGFTPDIIEELKSRFSDFLSHLGDHCLKEEFLLPTIIDHLVKEGKAEVTVLNTNDKWFGVTYKEDKEFVVKSFQDLVDKGIYPKRLFE